MEETFLRSETQIGVLNLIFLGVMPLLPCVGIIYLAINYLSIHQSFLAIINFRLELNKMILNLNSTLASPTGIPKLIFLIYPTSDTVLSLAPTLPTTFVPGSVTGRSGDVTFEPEKIFKQYSNEGAIYISDDFEVNEELKK